MILVFNMVVIRRMDWNGLTKRHITKYIKGLQSSIEIIDEIV